MKWTIYALALTLVYVAGAIFVTLYHTQTVRPASDSTLTVSE